MLFSSLRIKKKKTKKKRANIFNNARFIRFYTAGRNSLINLRCAINRISYIVISRVSCQIEMEISRFMQRWAANQIANF